ncbi:MAG: helix-turn-helix transcriptional regulator [Firmicutes bacterium]|nr:helix-turn-helix transcriptional regulator [Bacillota bacterium]
MDIKSAIVVHMLEVCDQRGICPNDLAVRSGVTPSTVYSMLDSRRKDLSVSTLKKLCDGLDLPLVEFFAADVFRNLEQELR